MHKNPPKQRFITWGPSTSLEGISKVIILCLKRLLQYAKSGAKYCHAYKPYNTFFIMDNREEVINFLTTSNFRRNCGGAKSVCAYDFSNLYTSIPHQKLKMNIRKFINEVFDAFGKFLFYFFYAFNISGTIQPKEDKSIIITPWTEITRRHTNI